MSIRIIKYAIFLAVTVGVLKSNGKMKRLLIQILVIGQMLVCAMTTLSGQNLYDLTSFYRQQWQYLNPGAVDYTFMEHNSNKFFFNGSVRQQWRNLDSDAFPKVFNASIQVQEEALGIQYGGFLHSYQAGPIQHYRLQGNFAYKIFLGDSKNRYISVGLNLGVGEFSIRLDDIRWVDQQYTENYSNIYPDLSFGVFYVDFPKSHYYRSNNGLKKYYAGLSVPKTFIDPIYNEINTTLDSAEFQRVYPLYFLGGVDYQIAEGFRLEPSFWIRWNFNNPDGNSYLPHSIDLVVTGTVLNKYWARLGYDTANSVHGSLGSFVPLPVSTTETMLLKLGVGADFGFGQLGALGPSFEAILGLAW